MLGEKAIEGAFRRAKKRISNVIAASGWTDVSDEPDPWEDQKEGSEWDDVAEPMDDE